MTAAETIVVFAPNWLGDAVMALPATADLPRARPEVRVVVYARPSVAPLFSLVPWVSGVGSPFALRNADENHEAFPPDLRPDPGSVSALLLPNSFRSALTARRAGIRDLWGYRTDWRGPLLTRAIPRPAMPLHQAAYYQHLTAALGFPSGPAEPRLDLSAELRAAGARLLEDAGWNARAPLVALAPGAAYGGAKRWPPEYFGALARQLADDGVATVMIGSRADAATGRDVAAAAGSAPILDLIGRTDLPQLAGVLASCRAIASNDSGAMHFAAAVGVPVVAIFGPTNEQATSPLPNGPDAKQPRVLVEPVACRPCMLRECPIDHRCLRGIAPSRVHAAVRELL